MFLRGLKATRGLHGVELFVGARPIMRPAAGTYAEVSRRGLSALHVHSCAKPSVALKVRHLSPGNCLD